MCICIDCRAASRPRSGAGTVSDSETKSSSSSLRSENEPPSAFGQADHGSIRFEGNGGTRAQLPPPPGRTVKAHATTTALWMRSYGSVLVRVPAFG